MNQFAEIQKIKKTFFILLLFLITFTLISYGSEIKNIKFKSNYIKKYEKFEVSFDVNGSYKNPYDADEIKVDAIIEYRSVKIVFPCFYYVPVDLDKYSEKPEKGCWKFRFAFQKNGRYKIKFRVTEGKNVTQSNPIIVKVKGAAGKGFIHIDKNDKQLYRYDNGTPFHPIGLNVAWNNKKGLLNEYINKIKVLEDNKVKIFRYWFVSFARQELEWSNKEPDHGDWNKGYGIRKYNQKVGAMFDSIVNICETKGIAIQPVFESHGEWNSRVNPEWKFNPYNIDNGGYMKSASEFFTSERAFNDTKNRYRYILARWTYSTSIFAWEFFNEVNYAEAYNVDNLSDDVVKWHDEMAKYLKSIDPTGRFSTTSTDKSELLYELDKKATSLDQIQFHRYSDYIETATLQASIEIMSKMKKSYFCGEYGSNQESANNKMHGYKEANHVRKTSWLLMMQKVPSYYWFWDIADTLNFYKVYKPLSDFFDGMNLETMKVFVPDPSPKPTFDTIRAVGSFSWMPSYDNMVTVDKVGTMIGINGLSSFLNRGKTDTASWCEFSVDYPQSGNAYILIQSVDHSQPNKIGINIDGKYIAFCSFKAPGEFSVPVPAGKHIIRFYNKGKGWITAREFGFTGFLIPALKGLGLKNNKSAIGYLRDLRCGEFLGLDASPKVEGAKITIPELKKGTYIVTFTDPKSGEINEITAENKDGNLLIDLPLFKEDIAFKAILK